jgi:hypothetical protein
MRCSILAHNMHTFIDLPSTLHEYLEQMICSYLGSVTGQRIGMNDPSAKVTELKQEIYRLPTASHELKALLNQHPALSLQDRANLLYYLKSDLTDCDLEGLEEPTGWRIPKVNVPGMNVAMRFLDVVPSQFVKPDEQRLNRVPFQVNLAKSQMEVVGFRLYSPAQLHGVVMATGFGPGSPFLEYFQIYRTKIVKEFEEALMYNFESTQLYSHQHNDSLAGPENYKVIMLERPFDLIEDTPYVLKFKLAGCPAFYRGNPFTLKESKTVFGPDGTVFYFSEGLNLTDEYVSGRNHLTGALIGLVYKLVR